MSSDGLKVKKRSVAISNKGADFTKSWLGVKSYTPGSKK
jgi:hypothetical protein